MNALRLDDHVRFMAVDQRPSSVKPIGPLRRPSSHEYFDRLVEGRVVRLGGHLVTVREDDGREWRVDYYSLARA
jgi:hypothetical protein